MKKVSGLFKSNEQYFILRTLFEQVILPVVASKYKSHKRLGEDIFEFVLFYVGGFLAHCLIGKDGIDCLLNHLESVESPGLKRKWGELAILCCKDEKNLKS